jgi:hypothetical protein
MGCSVSGLTRGQREGHLIDIKFQLMWTGAAGVRRRLGGKL